MANATVSPNKEQGFPASTAYAVAVIALAVGLIAGYMLNGKKSAPSATVATAPTGTPPAAGMGAHPKITVEQMKQMAALQASSLVEKLKTNPNDPKLLAQIGGIYQSSHQFKDASDYYAKALKLDPKNIAVRNELASCLYYGGDADAALKQLDLILRQDPKNVNAQFNQGMIRWKGKDDSAGAIAAWTKLLKDNPNLDRKPIVEKLIADAKSAPEAPKQ